MAEPIKFNGYCPVCRRNEETAADPKLIFLRDDCPACLRKFPKPKGTVGPMRLEDAPERIIEIIQSGKVSREEREAALTELLRRFQFLIRKYVHAIYYKYQLGKNYNWEMADFMQDGLLEFMDLVLNDFKIKSNPEDTGLAVFGNYIKVKFYYRVLFRTQEKLRKMGYESVSFVDFDPILRGVDKSRMAAEIREAIVVNSFDYTEEVISDMTDAKFESILNDLVEISRNLVEKKKIDERDQKIWEMLYASGLNVNDISQEFASKTNNEKLGISRVRQIARDTNEAILVEFGRVMAIRITGIDVFPLRTKGR